MPIRKNIGLFVSYKLEILKKLKILLIEDEFLVRNQTQKILGVFFNHVIVAANGIEALELLEQSPDLILCDIKMPQMDGLTFAKRLRAMNNDTPIILLTSYSDQETLLKAVNLGIDGYLLKPIELDQLLEALERVVKKLKINEDIVLLGKNLTYNVLSNELYKDGKIITLGKKERLMLKLFIENPNRTLTKDEIIATIWDFDDITDSALKNLLGRLRSKIGYDLVVSVKNLGWKINKLK